MPAPAATIPMPGDLIDLIGPVAQHVENRSLLLDKFVFHKNWGLHEIKSNDAHRWSLLRIAEGGALEIGREAKKRKEEADRLAKKGLNPDKVEKLRIEASLAEDLAKTASPTPDLSFLRASHTRRFLGLFRKAYSDRASITIGQMEGRLAINLADSLIQNAGICLDRLFGLPYIPGSAVKGVCRHSALEELASAEGEERAKLFKVFVAVFGTAESDFEPAKPARRPGEKGKPAGSLFPYLDIAKPVDQKGAIGFLPAYPVNAAKVVVDLSNVHYPLYYGGSKKQNIAAGLISSLKEESPQPNPFPVVEVGAQFAFCLVLNGMNDDQSLLATANRWLEKAITIHGLGAKTSAGYGWFSLQPAVLEKMLAEIALEERRQHDQLASASLEPLSHITEKLSCMKEPESAGALNKYAYEEKFWPKESTVEYELTLFEFIKAEAPRLAETKNGKKAMIFLAQKLNRPFP